MNKQKINYQKVLEKEIESIIKEKEKKKVLLHACCAPCSSYVLEYLSDYFDITLLFYNPNISEESEYYKRKEELLRFIERKKFKNNVDILDCSYDSKKFYEFVPDRKNDVEGGESCFLCYRLRLEKTAIEAKKGRYDYFTTTLSISPLKNASKLNEIGEEMSEKYGIKYLYSDFKKKNGYKRSIELSAEYNLYRQNYCGCIFSYNEAKNRELAK